MRLLACLALVFAAGAARADDFKPEPGFELIFNGKNLTGWKTLGTKDSPASRSTARPRRSAAGSRSRTASWSSTRPSRATSASRRRTRSPGT